MSKPKLSILLLLFSIFLLMQGFWSQDFSANSVVIAPAIFFDIAVSGKLWFLGSIITELSGYLINSFALRMLTDKANWVFLLYIPIAALYIILVLNYILILPKSLYEYGIIWNDVLYFFILPIFAVINLFKIKESNI